MCAYIHKYTRIVYKYTHMLICNLNLHESNLTRAKHFCSVKPWSDLFNKYITNNNWTQCLTGYTEVNESLPANCEFRTQQHNTHVNTINDILTNSFIPLNFCLYIFIDPRRVGWCQIIKTQTGEPLLICFLRCHLPPFAGVPPTHVFIPPLSRVASRPIHQSLKDIHISNKIKLWSD